MIFDLREEGVELAEDCDVCIVGAGAAGITLAMALVGQGRRVVVLESGGIEYEAAVQALYTGERVGLENASPSGCRLRFLGGTTNHWKGWCAPLQEIDFEPRGWVAQSGWPITRAELQPYYDRAQMLCELRPMIHGSDRVPQYEPDFATFDPERARIGFFRFSAPTRFGEVYLASLTKARGIRLYLHANAVALETDETASVVRSIRTKTLEGKAGEVRPRFIVLACGGMENARLLLCSDGIRPAGLGNESGRVGRYFMQHIEHSVGRILSPDVERLVRHFARRRSQEADYRVEIAVARASQERHRTLNTGFTIGGGLVRGEGSRALRGIWRDLRGGRWPDDFSRRLRTVLSDLESVGDALYGEEEHFADLHVRSESLPNRDSRITLREESDRLGMRKIRVDWRLTPFDKRSVLESTRRVAEEFGRLGLGRIELAEWLGSEDGDWPQPIWGGCHHMGTTRMSELPADGVVDADCRAHSVTNLYLAGSSVFSTSGYVPPTLTIVALALRLGDHLKERLAVA